MKVLLISGHGAGDVGAVGCGYREADLTRELVNLIAPKLRQYATVDVYNQARNAFADVNAGVFNVGRYDYVLEVHFNAFNLSAHGTECYVLPEEGRITVEQEIMKNVSKFFALRDNDNIFDGVKKTRFAVINQVKRLGMSGALLETCFIDNQANMNTYQAKKNEIAQGIADGIAVGFELKKGNGGGGTTTPTPPQISQKPTLENKLVFTYAVKAGGRELPEVANLSDFAGLGDGTPITDIKIKCNFGSLRYRVHVKGEQWLPWVTGYDWNDHENGYAGNGKPIDAIQIYYDTPADYAAKHGYLKATYRTSPINSNDYYSWQNDTEIDGGQDGYAGCFGIAIDKFQLH